MGLFNKKMSFDKIYEVISSVNPSDSQLYEAYKAFVSTKGLTSNDRRMFPYVALFAVHGLFVQNGNIETAINNLLFEERQHGLTNELLGAFKLNFFFEKINVFFAESGITSCGIYVARACENGWGTEKNHVKAVKIAKQLQNISESYTYYKDVQKICDEILKNESVAAASKEDDRKEITDNMGDEVSERDLTSTAPSDVVEYKTIRYDGGDIYEGDTVNGEKHGKGKYTSAKGWVYEGEFVNGAITGHGMIKFASGGTYDGEFIDQKRNGHGVETYPDGAIYDGEWKDDKRNGHGKYVLTDGMYYDGEWANDVKQGRGKFTEKSGEYTLIYEGEYIGGKREGRFEGCVIGGTSGKTYLRFFRNDESIGVADKTEENKNWNADDFNDYWRKSNEELNRNHHEQAAGENSNDYPAMGKVLLSGVGGKYNGDMVDGVRFGYGMCEYDNGDCYKGCFKNDRFNGVGRYDFSNGSWYFGQFENGQFNGYGVYFNENQYHIGSFVDGMCNTESRIKASMCHPVVTTIGEGSTTYCDMPKKNDGYTIYRGSGKILYIKNDQTWVARYNDETEKMEVGQVDEDSALHDSHAVTLNMESLVAIGEMKHGVPNGISTVYYANGSVVKGIFENGTPTKILLETDQYGHIIEEND